MDSLENPIDVYRDNLSQRRSEEKDKLFYYINKRDTLKKKRGNFCYMFSRQYRTRIKRKIENSHEEVMECIDNLDRLDFERRQAPYSGMLE